MCFANAFVVICGVSEPQSPGTNILKMSFQVILSIGLLIVVAKLLEGVLRRFRLNAIVAYTAAGVALGPASGIIEPTTELTVLLGIGIFLFFFLIGLDEIDISGFIANIRGRFFIAASLSVFITLLLSLTVTTDVLYDFGLGLNFTEALALSGILSLSSLGLVSKVLVDEGHLRKPIGIQIFVTVFIAELLALLLVGFMIGENVPELNWQSVLTLLAKILGFTVATWLLSRYVIPPVIVLLQRTLQVPQLSFGLVIGGLFVVVGASEAAGVHGTLGALLFGAALSGLPHQLRRDIGPGMRSAAEGLFVPLFFASAGLHLSLSFTALPPWTIAALVVVPLAGKFAGSLIGAFVSRLEMPVPLATGLMAKGVAEVALLLVMLETGILGHDVFSLLVLIMFVYLLLGPTIINFAINRAKPSEGVTMPMPLPASLARFALDDITVEDILDRTRSYPKPDLSVRGFVDQWILPHQHDYVIVGDGNLSGIVSLSMLRYLPKEAWSSTPLEKVVRRKTPQAWSDEPVEDVLQRMLENSLTIIPVFDRESEDFLGALTSQDVLDLITLEARGGH